MIREAERGPVLDQEPPCKRPEVAWRLGAHYETFKDQRGCENSGRLLCQAARQGCYEQLLVQYVVQLAV